MTAPSFKRVRLGCAGRWGWAGAGREVPSGGTPCQAPPLHVAPDTREQRGPQRPNGNRTAESHRPGGLCPGLRSLGSDVPPAGSPFSTTPGGQPRTWGASPCSGGTLRNDSVYLVIGIAQRLAHGQCRRNERRSEVFSWIWTFLYPGSLQEVSAESWPPFMCHQSSAHSLLRQWAQ